MNRTSAQKISDWLIILCTMLLALDVLALPLLPVLAYFYIGPAGSMTFASLMGIFHYDFDDGLGNLLSISIGSAWEDPDSAVLSLVLLVCGVCAAVILAQGVRILASIADGEPFSPQNAPSLRRAAMACFCISAAATLRTVFKLCLIRTPAPLFSYMALFIPLFIMAGLLFLVMSGLFSQAVEIQTENDLTI